MNKKEAIEIIKKNWPDSRYTMLRDALQTLIPELKESEDERMVKFIKNQLFNIKKTITENYELDAKLTKAIDWLEKQGEQKSQGKSALELWKDMRFEVYTQASGNRHEPNYSDNTTKMFSIDDIDEIFEKVDEKQGEQKVINEYNEHEPTSYEIEKWNEAYEKGYNIGYMNGKNEQKPTDAIAEMKQVEWSEEDEKLYNSALWHIKNSCGNGGKDSGEFEVYNWLKSLKDRVQPQPKQVWSEEDSRILYNVKAFIGYAAGQRGVKDELFKEANEWLDSLPIGFVHNENYNEDMVTLIIDELKQIAYNNNTPEQYKVEINWLKSLKDRVHPKQEWSEEDEKERKRVVGLLEGWLSTFKETCYAEDCKCGIVWLKSLRSQPNWRPSEEQIRAVFDASERNDKLGSVLRNLYEDLRKL